MEGVETQREQRNRVRKENRKLKTWHSTLCAHRRGLVKLSMTCRALAAGLRAVEEGQQLMKEAAHWRKGMLLKRRNSASSDARVYWSGVERNDGWQN